jgi:membrane-associated phospholipid phosphatase
MAAPAPIETPSDSRWLIGVWAVVGAFALLTVVRSFQVGIPLRDPRGDILLTRIAISAGLFLVYAALDAAYRTWRAGERVTLRHTRTTLRTRWTRQRLVLAVGALAAYHLVYFCYHNLKSWDVYNKPRDAMLLDWDRWLFLGHSPAVLLHDLLGEHVAAWVLAYWYETFGTLVLLAIVAPVVFTTRVRDGYVAMVSGIWVWIFGTASYYLIPSLGPFDSAPEEFAGLPHMMIQETQARYMGQRAHLLADPGAHDAFAQVSAFASLHVGVSTVIWLMLRYYGLRRLSQVMGVFLAGTIVATVYLGWHFFVDDVAGMAIAWAACWLGKKMVYPHGRPDRP